MKRLLKSVLAVALCICCLIPFAGCGDDDKPNLPSTFKNGEWIEVQSITYYLGTETSQHSAKEYKLTSSYSIEYEDEQITKETYDNAAVEQKSYPNILTPSTLPVNRNKRISEIKEKFGTYYLENYKYNYDDYYYDITYEYYYTKRIVKGYKLQYVRVRFLDNNCMDINFYVSNDGDYTTIRVLPISFSITYFND